MKIKSILSFLFANIVAMPVVGQIKIYHFNTTSFVTNMTNGDKDTISIKNSVVVQTKDTIYEFTYEKLNYYDSYLDSSYSEIVLNKPLKYSLNVDNNVIFVNNYSSWYLQHYDTTKTYLSFIPGTCTQDDIIDEGYNYAFYYDQNLSHAFLCYDSDSIFTVEDKEYSCSIFSNHSPLGRRRIAVFTDEGIPLLKTHWHNGSNWRVDQNKNFEMHKNEIQLVNDQPSILGSWNWTKSVSKVYKITTYKMKKYSYSDIKHLVQENVTYYISKYLD